MQRRNFITWAALPTWGGASALAMGLSGCGGGDSDSNSVSVVLPRDGSWLQSATNAQPKLLSDGSFLVWWSSPGQTNWQRYSATGKAMGAEVRVAFEAQCLEPLAAGGFALASKTTGSDTATMRYSIQRYDAEGRKTSELAKNADVATYVIAVLPDGSFLAASTNALLASYGEPARPTAYELSQVQRYDSTGSPVGTPTVFQGTRGQWFKVAARAQGGY